MVEKEKIVDNIVNRQMIVAITVQNKFEVAGVTIQQASGGVIEFYEPEHTSKMGMDDASIREHEEVTKVKVRMWI